MELYLIAIPGIVLILFIIIKGMNKGGSIHDELNRFDDMSNRFED